MMIKPAWACSVNRSHIDTACIYVWACSDGVRVRAKPHQYMYCGGMFKLMNPLPYI